MCAEKRPCRLKNPKENIMMEKGTCNSIRIEVYFRQCILMCPIKLTEKEGYRMHFICAKNRVSILESTKESKGGKANM